MDNLTCIIILQLYLMHYLFISPPPHKFLLDAFKCQALG